MHKGLSQRLGVDYGLVLVLPRLPRFDQLCEGRQGFTGGVDGVGVQRLKPRQKCSAVGKVDRDAVVWGLGCGVVVGFGVGHRVE